MVFAPKYADGYFVPVSQICSPHIVVVEHDTPAAAAVVVVAVAGSQTEPGNNLGLPQRDPF